MATLNEIIHIVNRVRDNGGDFDFIHGRIALRPVPRDIKVQMEFFEFCRERSNQVELLNYLNEEGIIHE